MACVAIGKAGAKNAAYLAIQILGQSNPSLNEALRKDREENARKILDKNKLL